MGLPSGLPTAEAGGLPRYEPVFHYPSRGSGASLHLPDKEFRYLRTVIVTAAVHQGLDSKLALILVTFWHWAGITPYTSSYEFAESCVFGKQSPEFFRCGLESKLNSRQVLSRSYDRCFAEFLNNSYLVRLSVLH